MKNTPMSLLTSPWAGVKGIKKGEVVFLMVPESAKPMLFALREAVLKAGGHVPDVPTMAQAGVPEYDFSTWTGLVAPANTPPAIVNRLFTEITKALNQPAVRDAFAKQAMVVKPNPSPEAFRQFIKNEIDRIRKVVQAADIKPEG